MPPPGQKTERKTNFLEVHIPHSWSPLPLPTDEKMIQVPIEPPYWGVNKGPYQLSHRFLNVLPLASRDGGRAIGRVQPVQTHGAVQKRIDNNAPAALFLSFPIG
jgi:hypothetical protein